MCVVKKNLHFNGTQLKPIHFEYVSTEFNFVHIDFTFACIHVVGIDLNIIRIQLIELALISQAWLWKLNGILLYECLFGVVCTGCIFCAFVFKFVCMHVNGIDLIVCASCFCDW